MPERPDLEYQLSVLRSQVVGREISAVEVKKPVVLRMAVPGRPGDLLPGRRIDAVARRGHFLLFTLSPASGDSGIDLAVHPMLAGRFDLVDIATKTRADVALTLALSGPDEVLRYRDDKEMGKVYVLRRGDHAKAPGLAMVGLDVLDPAVFTREAFRALAHSRRDQAKVFLMDKAAIDNFGNAYADEALWEARVHPKAWVRKLDDGALDALHDAAVTVLSEARDEIARRAPPLDAKVRDFLKVRLRKGEPCPRCGAPIRVCGVRGHDAFFCASCQVDARGSGLVTWKRPS